MIWPIRLAGASLDTYRRAKRDGYRPGLATAAFLAQIFQRWAIDRASRTRPSAPVSVEERKRLRLQAREIKASIVK